MSTVQSTPTRGFHPAHVGHLVMGLAFLGLTAIWGAVEAGTVETDNVRWLLPLPWVFAGLAGLLAAVFSGRRRPAPLPTYPPMPPVTSDSHDAHEAHEAHDPSDLDEMLEADHPKEQS